MNKILTSVFKLHTNSILTKQYIAFDMIEYEVDLSKARVELFFLQVFKSLKLKIVSFSMQYLLNVK